MPIPESTAKHCCTTNIVPACRQVAAQSKLFISAGFETTALTLAYCIYLLSKHPKQQAKLQHEVDIFKGRIGYADLESLPYTSAVVLEEELAPLSSFHYNCEKGGAGCLCKYLECCDLSLQPRLRMIEEACLIADSSKCPTQKDKTCLAKSCHEDRCSIDPAVCNKLSPQLERMLLHCR